jgi:hypothetical protein
MRTSFPQTSLSSRRRVRSYRLRRARNALALLVAVIVALTAYWLGYLHGSYQVPQKSNAESASATPAPGGFKRVAGYPDGDPAVKYGATPIRSEP